MARQRTVVYGTVAEKRDYPNAGLPRTGKAAPASKAPQCPSRGRNGRQVQHMMKDNHLPGLAMRVLRRSRSTFGNFVYKASRGPI